MSECKLCGLKPEFYHDGSYDGFSSSFELAPGNYTTLYASADERGRLFIYGYGDDETERYYPNYCPECGRKLYDQVDLVRCKDCAERMEQEMSEARYPDWISAEDCLPGTDGRYLCRYGFYKNNAMKLMFTGVLDYYAIDPEPHWQHAGLGLYVTHWMPLPEPPKEMIERSC